MTWDEIRDALVRRWPEQFACDTDATQCIITTSDRAMRWNDILSDISAICKAAGAVVWHEPFSVAPLAWRGVWWDVKRCIKQPTGNIYKTKEEAELAALGEWLRATEVQS